MQPEQLEHLQRILRGAPADPQVSPAVYQDLIQKGAVLALAADGSPEALQALANAAALTTPTASPEGAGPEDTVLSGDAALAQLCLRVLEILAAQDAPAVQAAQEARDAREALCALAVRANHAEARRIVLRRGYLPAEKRDQALFYLLTGQTAAYWQLDPEQESLSALFHSAEAPTRQRILAAAQTAGLAEWALVVTALGAPEEQLAELSARYPDFHNPQARRAALAGLRALAAPKPARNEAACEAVCQVYLRTGESAFAETALEFGCLPQDPAQRALFYMLTDQRQKFESLDFDHRLLAAAYDQADRPLRLRITAQMRKFGRLDWTQVLETGRQTRWAADMTDADWETVLQALAAPERGADLWRLVHAAPPVWAARGLLGLRGQGWVPAPGDAASFELVCQQALECSRGLPGVSLQYELACQPNEISALAYCAALDMLACASSDLSLQLRDLSSGQLRASLAGLRGKVTALAFSPDGEFLAAATDKNSIDLFRRKDLALVKTLSGHKAIVRSLAVDPDGRCLASGSFDQTIKLWRFPHGQEIKTISGRTAEIFSLDIARGGKYLLSGGSDGALAVWEMPTGNFLTAAPGHTGTITSAAVSPDLTFAASTGRDRSVRTWSFPDLSARSVLGQLDAPATGLVIFPRQPFLAAAGLDGAVQVWNTTTGKLLSHFSAHSGPVTSIVYGAAGAANSAYLVTSSSDQTLRCWDLSTLLLAHTAQEQIDFETAARVQERARDRSLPAAEANWLGFIQTLLQFRRRFDIVIEEPARISTGIFDIEL